jgi:uncharacterized protein DUF1573
MKTLLLMVSALVVSAGLFAQAQTKPEVVKFKEIKYDFGKIKQSVPATHDFTFTNISDGPVVIESTVASCGCTTPVKPEGAIPKGKTEKITASYNAAAVGPFNKTITVKIAGQDQPIQLNITGEVLTADAYAKYASEKQKTVKTGS